MMDKGTDAMDVLTGATLPIKLGIIGVVNRGHIAQDMSIDDVNIKEKEFLQEHYSKIADMNGCPYLASTLSDVSINSTDFDHIV